MKRFLLLICLFVSALTHAQNTAGVVPNEADIKAQYDKEQYTQAIEGYRELLLASKATPSAALYYNLGNAYYRNGELGWAILTSEPSDLPLETNTYSTTYKLPQAKPATVWSTIPPIRKAYGTLSAMPYRPRHGW